MSVFDFVTEYFFVSLWLIITTLVNMLAPMAGSVIVTPVTAYFTDPYRAIGISGLVFFATTFHRVYLFRKELFASQENILVLKRMLPLSILGAIAGGTMVSYLNIKLLSSLIVVGSFYFIISVIKNGKKSETKSSAMTQYTVSVISGFLQGSGLPGSDLRNNYLRTIISEVSLRAVTSAIGMINFLIAGSIIYFYGHLTNHDLIFVLSIIPFLIPVQIYGKRILTKMDDRNAKLLAVFFSIIGLVLVIYEYLL